MFHLYFYLIEMLLSILLYLYFLAQPINSHCDYDKIFSKVFKSCWPRQSLSFPANYATCECKKCPIQMKFSCFSESIKDYLFIKKNTYRWSVDENQQRCSDCDTCPSLTGSEEFICSNNNNGYKTEIRECHCKHNCLGTSIKCGNDNTWNHGKEENPCLQKTFQVGDGTSVEYKSGKFIVSCKPDFVPITSQGWVNCTDEVQLRSLPMCKLVETSPLTVAIICKIIIVSILLIWYIIRWRLKVFARERVQYDDVQNTRSESSEIPANIIESNIPINQDPAYLDLLETNNYEYITCRNNETISSNVNLTINEPSCSQNVQNCELPIDLKENNHMKPQQVDDENHYEIINEFK